MLEIGGGLGGGRDVIADTGFAVDGVVDGAFSEEGVLVLADQGRGELTRFRPRGCRVLRGSCEVGELLVHVVLLKAGRGVRGKTNEPAVQSLEAQVMVLVDAAGVEGAAREMPLMARVERIAEVNCILIDRLKILVLLEVLRRLLCLFEAVMFSNDEG
jgi:hypothetical protein